jgi:argininosuccinate lyase
MFSLNKLASDLLLFSTSEFGFVDLDAEICTGSSIMPQKKNPDVLELIRAKYHVVLAEELKVKSLIGNLISGYNRDLQLTKAPLFCGIDTVIACLKAAGIVLKGIKFDEDACKKALTVELYATKSAYELVLKGTPFREAYRIVAQNKKTGNEGDG